MKNLIITLSVIFSFSAFSQSVVLDAKNGTTTITPAKVSKTQGTKVAAPAQTYVAAKVEVKALESYVFTGITLQFARQIKNSLLSVVYQEVPNDLDNKAYLQVRDFIISNRGFANPTKTIDIKVSKDMSDNILSSLRSFNTQEELEKRYKEDIAKINISKVLRDQAKKQEDAANVSENNRLRN